MNTVYQLPPILNGSPAEQVRQLRDYLARIVRQLPDTTDPGQVERIVEKAVAAQGAQSQKTAVQTARSQAKALQALIVKTADEIYQTMDSIETSLSGLYVARSEFGEYVETVNTEIVQTAKETVESYDFQAQISAANAALGSLEEYLTEIRGEIQRGIITDPETGEEALGIAISQQLSFTGETRTEDGITYYELSPGQTLGLYTSTGWQFWINGSKRGWFDSADGMLHVAQIVVESRLQLGADWIMTTVNGFGLRYTGE